MRFVLIDQVLTRDETTLTAVKNVSSAEEYLADHFPSFAVLPGVMMLEALIQAGRLLVSGELTDPMRARWVLGQARQVRYGAMVKPGQSLHVSVSIKSRDEPLGMAQLTGKGTVNDQVAVQAKFDLRHLRQWPQA